MKTKCFKLVFCAIFVCGFISYVQTISRPSTIVFENNQFKNVVVAIHDSVEENAALIDILKVCLVSHTLTFFS